MKKSELRQLIREEIKKLHEGTKKINLDRRKVAKRFSDLGWYTGFAVIRELKPLIYTFPSSPDKKQKDLYDKKRGIIPVFKKYYGINLKKSDIAFSKIKRRSSDDSEYITISIDLNDYVNEEIKNLKEASYRYWIEVSKKDAAILWDVANSIPSIDYIIEPGRKSNVITFYDSFHGDKVAAELKKRKIKYDDNL